MKGILILIVTAVLKQGIEALETQIDVVKEGSCRGKEEARDGVEVVVDYDGFLVDNFTGDAGKKFTSTYKLSDPFSFTIGEEEVILGLEQGLIGFCAGSELILNIPSELAYGQAGAGDAIPPGADLIFEVVIIDIKLVETDHEKNIRLEAKAREEELKRREEELEQRKIGELKAKEDYAKLLKEEENRRKEQLERNKVAEAKAAETYEKQLKEEEKRRKEQLERNKEAEAKAKETYEKQLAEELKRREEQQELVKQQLKRTEEQQKLVAEELERREAQQKLVNEEFLRRKAQQKLVELELIAREEEAERRRIDSIARQEQKELVAAELLEREKEQERRIIDQNARQHEQERRDQEQQTRIGGVKVSDEEKINQARIFFKNRRVRIKQQ